MALSKQAKQRLVLVICVPILAYLSYDIYTQLFPSTSEPGGNAPAQMTDLPKLPENANTAQIPLPQKPDIPAIPQSGTQPPANQQQPPQPPQQAVQQAARPQRSAQQPKPNTPAKSDNKDNKNNDDKTIVLAQNTAFGENPFIEMSGLSEEHRLEQSMLPAIPHGQNPIPNVSNVPVPPPPTGIAIPTPPEGAVASAAPVVTGTIESSNGINFTLMSDGSVVNEGGSSGSDNIAFIGGGNVQMDSGKSVDDLINSIQVNRTDAK